MSELSLGRKSENKRGWLLPLLIIALVVAAAVAALAFSGAFSGGAASANTPDTPQALWQSQAVESYRYTLQVGCFCLVELTQPVIIEVQDGQVASITYVADGAAANPEFFAAYNSIDKLFTVIYEAEAQDPARLDVKYDDTFGVPLSVNIDISELLAEEEIYLTVTDFQPIK
jgi:hypothetical protein